MSCPKCKSDEIYFLIKERKFKCETCNYLWKEKYPFKIIRKVLKT